MSEHQNSSTISNTPVVTASDRTKGIFESPSKKNAGSWQAKTLRGGKSVGTLNGGYLQPIMFRVINAGEKILKWDLKHQLRILSPRVPILDETSLVFRAMFVPMTFIVADYDQKRANKDSIDNALPGVAAFLPSFNVSQTVSSALGVTYQNTYAWKHKVASVYVPNGATTNRPFSGLPVRAYHAARDAFCRAKNYQPARAKYTQVDGSIGGMGSEAEIYAIRGQFDSNGMPILTGGYGEIQKDLAPLTMYNDINIRPQAPVALYTTASVRNQAADQMQVSGDVAVNQTLADQPYQSFDSSASGLMYRQNIMHADWQTEVAEYRRRVLDSDKNDWDIIAELGGTTAVTTDRPVYLGDKVINVNYQQVTGTAPGTDSHGIETRLGTPGAYSVTIGGDTLFSHKEFKQDGILVITATISCPPSYQYGCHRQFLLRRTNDLYNPELANQNIDPKLREEITCLDNTANAVQGFKKKYSEFDELPDLFYGDVRSNSLVTTGGTVQNPLYLASYDQWHTGLDYRTIPGGVVSEDFFNDKTDQIIGRNDLYGASNTYSNDQALLATRHYVDMIRPRQALISSHAQPQPVR